ncbi:hypothetical protein BKA67DRAFT_571988 [Truncatella angustata]|uniref:Uncharacterized protein n=1 Tax=Truncatella angustata TaxID=152316 RepID=A0A9P8UGM0_9PEZI|nr:uncharacterized protein BKA67DRAFT_571988 [Truncatella angustata]KAH6651821.1 hypothetical protein BKA67DRAFT_571988 [Truncatella angustata]
MYSLTLALFYLTWMTCPFLYALSDYVELAESRLSPSSWIQGIFFGVGQSNSHCHINVTRKQLQPCPSKNTPHQASKTFFLMRQPSTF